MQINHPAPVISRVVSILQNTIFRFWGDVCTSDKNKSFEVTLDDKPSLLPYFLYAIVTCMCNYTL